jgi:hypothetical protein
MNGRSLIVLATPPTGTVVASRTLSVRRATEQPIHHNVPVVGAAAAVNKSTTIHVVTPTTLTSTPTPSRGMADKAVASSGKDSKEIKKQWVNPNQLTKQQKLKMHLARAKKSRHPK